jgi:AraC-like DNA-binding protein
MACYSLSLFIKKDRTLSQSYLAGSFSVFGFGMALFFICDHYFAGDKSEITRTFNLFFLTAGGVIVLTYFMSLMNPQKLTLKYFTFYIAAALAFSLLILLIDIKFAVILWVCYIIFTIISLYLHYRGLIRQHHFYEKQADLRKIAWCIAFFIIYAILALLKFFDTGILAKIIFNIGSVLTLTGIYVIGSRQEAIPAIDELKDITDIVSLDKQEENLFHIESKLKIYFEEQKPYLNPELSLSNVATAIGMNTTYLSRFMNRRLNVNFFTFVNNHRIDYAIRLIEERKGSITSDLLYMESGFKSRSVFYKLFHERTGFSPQKYIKNRH